MIKKVEISQKEFELADRMVREAVKLVRRGFQEKQVIGKIKKYRLKFFSARNAYVAARLRIKAKEKFGELAEKLFFDESGYRYSTPSVVAEYRADRLKDYSIADVSCGAGMQLAFFGKKSRAEGVEIDRKRAYIAALNVMALESEAEVYCGDAFEFETCAEVVFSDPARPESESMRTLRSLEPNPLKVAEKFASHKLVFELPPQMPPERVDAEMGRLKGEKEYTSLNFRLNRLAFYSKELSDCNVSAVSLPSRERVTSEDERVSVSAGEKAEIVTEVDKTVVHANLLENLVGKLGIEAWIVFKDARRTVIGVDEVVESAFLRYYEVVAVEKDLTSCKSALKKLSAGKVTLRFSLNPKEYWSVRRKLEEGLDGEEHYYLFRFGENYVVCRRFT